MRKDLKVFVIGLDGATFDILKPWVKKGYLPTIAKLIEGGVHGELKSTIPPVSGPAWFSFRSGKSPGVTGIYDFIERNFDTYEGKLINYGSLKIPLFYDIISDSGLTVGLLNVPTTYPPYKINGFIVSGFLTPSKEADYTYPKGLKADLDKITDGYIIDVRQGDYRDDDINNFLTDSIKLIKKRQKAVEYLRDVYNPNFFMVVFTSPDRVQHCTWKHIDSTHPEYDPLKSEKYMNSIMTFWQELDRTIGDLIKSADDKTIIILMSDHGFGPQTKKFYVNEWLKERGYLCLKQEDIKTKIEIGFLHGVINFLKKAGLNKYFKLLLPKKIEEKLPLNIPFQNMIDWSKTKAYGFPHTSVFGNIYINLKGREPEGIVEATMYDAIRDEIITDIKKLYNPKKSTKLQVEVFKREEIYSGPYVNQAPDLIYYIDDFESISIPSFKSKYFIEEGSFGAMRNGTHRMNGIFIAKGPGIRKGKTIERAEIIDIAPTILHIFGLPIPKDMDGKVLKEIFTPNSLFAKQKITCVDLENTRKKMEKEKIRGRIEELKNVGGL